MAVQELAEVVGEGLEAVLGVGGEQALFGFGVV